MAQFGNALFNGTPAQDIDTGYTDDGGNTWTRLGTGGFLSWQIAGSGTEVYSPGNTANYTSGVPANADYYVKALVHVYNSSNTEAGVIARADTTVSYERYEAKTDGTTWTLEYRDTGNAQTILGTYSQALSTSTTYELVLECIGTAIKVYIDGVLRISVTDATISAKRRAGIKGDVLAGTYGDKTILSFEAWDGAFAFTAITLAGPSSGLVNVASTDFTVSLA